MDEPHPALGRHLLEPASPETVNLPFERPVTEATASFRRSRSTPEPATLSTFAVIVLLVASLGTVGASLSADGTAIAEPDAAHPADSRVSADYAESLERRGIPASPEILLFASRDGNPHPVRGVDYDSFATVSDARIVEGTVPTADKEAVVASELVFEPFSPLASVIVAKTVLST